MNEEIKEIRCVVAPISQGHILVPNALMADVVTYAEPTPFDGGPEWLLGSIDWQGWNIPSISYAGLLQLVDMEPTQKAKLMIVRSLMEQQRMPYMGILVQGIPRLTAVTPENIEETGEEDNRLGLFGRAQVENQAVLIPDMDRLAQLVIHAAYGALPIAGYESSP